MRTYHRYGVYYAPPAGSALARFGAAWLGWDAEAAREVAHPEVPGLDVATLTATPRKYGFHATLKPPFRLAEGQDATVLADAVAHLAGRLAPVEVPPLALRRLGRFLALVPSHPSPDLARLAAACVTKLDRFRAPADAPELARRRRAGLTPHQERNLLAWGYPYVLDDFRFHLTLSGALTEDTARAAQAVLAPLTAPFCDAPLVVREICLFGERTDGRFHLVHRYPLTG